MHIFFNAINFTVYGFHWRMALKESIIFCLLVSTDTFSQESNHLRVIVLSTSNYSEYFSSDVVLPLRRRHPPRPPHWSIASSVRSGSLNSALPTEHRGAHRRFLLLLLLKKSFSLSHSFFCIVAGCRIGLTKYSTTPGHYTTQHTTMRR